MRLQKDLREFVELLNSNEVEFLVVGAFAVAYHGYPRYTGDLDLLIRPSAANAAKVLRASLNRIDLITSLSGLTFEEVWASGEDADLDGVPVRFIGAAALLRNKESTGRAKDLGDAEELRKSRFGRS
jgi:hypothetical protein